MPFTPSHAVVALAFLRTPLVPSAVAVGAVAPDLPYYAPIGISRELTHGLAGAGTVDLLIAGTVFLLWRFVLAAPVGDFAPRAVRERLSPTGGGRPGPIRLILIAVSLLIGILTHLAWDEFTHAGWLVGRLPALGTPVGPLALYSWLQHASTVLGLAGLGVWAVLWLRRTPARMTRVSRLTSLLRGGAWSIVLGVGGVVAVGVWIAGVAEGLPLLQPALVFRIARASIGAAGLLALVFCLAWWLLPRTRRART